MASRPLSDARLAEIRASIRRDTDYVRPGLVGLNDERQLRLPERRQLLAEVERLREGDEQRRLAESASREAVLQAHSESAVDDGTISAETRRCDFGDCDAEADTRVANAFETRWMCQRHAELVTRWDRSSFRFQLRLAETREERGDGH